MNNKEKGEWGQCLRIQPRRSRKSYAKKGKCDGIWGGVDNEGIMYCNRQVAEVDYKDKGYKTCKKSVVVKIMLLIADELIKRV
jgi:hypothetical protein